MSDHAPLPGAECDPALWLAWSGEGDREARRCLIDHYLPFAGMLAGRLYAKRQVDALEFDDYRHFAIMGLIEAIDRFDVGHDAGFCTFAACRITGAVRNGVAAQSEMQAQIGARARLRRERLESMREGAGVAEAASVTAGLFAQLAEVAIGLAIGHLLEDSGMYRGNEGQYPQNFYDGHALRELRRWFDRRIDGLPERERRIVRYHYYHGMSFERIADVLELGKGRVSQLHAQAMGMLRRARASMTTLDVRS